MGSGVKIEISDEVTKFIKSVQEKEDKDLLEQLKGSLGYLEEKMGFLNKVPSRINLWRLIDISLDNKQLDITEKLSKMIDESYDDRDLCMCNACLVRRKNERKEGRDVEDPA